MADNTPVPEGPSKPPPLPASGGGAPPPIPVDKTVPGGKSMVALSSVAKSAPDTSSPPPLPAKESTPLMGQPAPPPTLPSKLSSEERQRITMPLMTYPPKGNVTEVILPRKTDKLPRLASPSNPSIVMPPVVKKDVSPITPSPVKGTVTPPPPLPAKVPEPAKSKLPPLNPTGSPESIFLPDDKDVPDVEKPPADWKHLEPGELSPATKGLQSLEVFSRSQRVMETSSPVKDSPLISSQNPIVPPPLPSIKPAEKSAAPALGHVPPLLENLAGPHLEKLNAPHGPTQARKAETSSSPGPAKVQPGPGTSALKESEPKPATKREKSIPLFLFPPAKPKPKSPTPTTPVNSPTIKVEENKTELKTLSRPTQVSGAPAKSPLVNPSAMSATSSPIAKFPAPAASAPRVKAPALPTQVPGAPVKLPLVNPSTKPTAPPPILSPIAKPSVPASIAVPPPIPNPSAPTSLTLPISQAAAAQPTVPAQSVKPPPVNPAVKAATSLSTPLYAPRKLEEPHAVLPSSPATITTRSARIRKRNKIEAIGFYLVFATILVLLYIGAFYFGHETRIEGQVIPPPGMTLANEAWIVSDFRAQALGIVDDLAANRAPDLRDIQEVQDHVNRAQADVAAREERIRLLREQMQAAKDEIASIIKQAHDDAQRIWDSPGAQLEDNYNSRLNQLQKLFADRAKSLNLKYQPDNTYHSPEVWANAYRLALYDMPTGADSAKEHQWLEDQMKQWREFTKSVDDHQKQLREQAAQIQLATTPKVSDLNARIDEWKGRIDNTLAEEEPLKSELQQAQLDLSKAQAKEAGEDPIAYKQLYSLPGSTIIKHLPLAPNGRFSWRHVEKENPFAEGEKKHHYYLLVRATQTDGRQYWAYLHLILAMNETLSIKIEPSDFISTKSILRPDLSPEEQQR